MQNLPTWYDTGTVSVANGSTTVTASEAFWGDDAIMPGDLFCDPAQPLVPPQRVKEVTGDTTLELWAPWPGTAMATDPYEIRYVGIIERSTAQTRRVLEQLGQGNVGELQDLALLADRLIYSDEDGSLALTALTAKARQLLGRSDSSGMLTEIGAQPAGDYQPAGNYQPAGSYEPARSRSTSSENVAGTSTTIRGHAPADVRQNALAAIPSAEACKAFVNFDGTSGAIRSSKNVSAVQRVGNGDYVVYMTTPAADANYAVMASSKSDGTLPTPSNEFDQAITPYPNTTGNFLIYTGWNNGQTNGRTSPSFISAAVFR